MNTTKTCKFLQKLLKQKTQTLSDLGIRRVTILLLRDIEIMVTRKKKKENFYYLVYFLLGEQEFEFNVSSEKIEDVLGEIDNQDAIRKKTRKYTNNYITKILSYHDDTDNSVCYGILLYTKNLIFKVFYFLCKKILT